MLIFGLWYHLAPRSRYVDSSPRPNSVLSDSPDNVTVNFNRELSAQSRMNVLAMVTLSPKGEETHKVGKVYDVNGPDPTDASRKTLRVNVSPELPRGTYCVQWTVHPRLGVRSHGMFYFAVGMPLPPYLAEGSPEGLYEQYWPRRRHRATLIGGVILLLMAFFIPSRIWKLSR